MDILNTRNELQVEFTSLFFGESGVSDDVVEELASIAVLHDHIELFLCLDELDCGSLCFIQGVLLKYLTGFFNCSVG